MKQRRSVTALLLSLLAAAPVSARETRTVVTILAFSDYHSHALPFYSEGRPDQGGLARAIAFLKTEKARPNTLVVSGGDMMNKGTPTWSDEYRCLEWPWFDGIVDAMALGNHDLDYGPETFARCRASVRYPILSANLVTSSGAPCLAVGGKPYLVRETAGIRIGFFALGGPDVQQLVRKDDLPPGARWAEAIPAARDVVAALRKTEHADAVVLIGHEQREDDEALARAVPGIDVILGTHSHYKGDLRTIEGTATRYLSPYQYLTYVSRVRLSFEGRRLVDVAGELVKMDEARPADPEIAARVARLQADLAARRPERFQVLGRAATEIGDAGLYFGESAIGNWATDALRRATGTQVFVSSASSFRAALPPGEITVEAFYAAIPYPNRIATAVVNGAQLADLFSLSLSKAGSGAFLQQSGVRYRVHDGKPAEIQVLEDPGNPGAGYAPLDPAASYRVGATDYVAFAVSGYKELFAGARTLTRTDMDVHSALIAATKAGPIAGTLDGRSGGPTPP